MTVDEYLDSLESGGAAAEEAPTEPTETPPPPSGDVVPSGLGNRDLVNKSLQAIGASPVARAAILGDIEQESSFNPTLSDDRGTSHGLLQVGTPMYRQFQEVMKQAGIGPDNPQYVYNQVPFVLGRYQRQHPDRWEAMQNAPDAASALQIFRGTPDWGYGIAGKRYQYAADYEQRLAQLEPQLEKKVGEGLRVGFDVLEKELRHEPLEIRKAKERYPVETPEMLARPKQTVDEYLDELEKIPTYQPQTALPGGQTVDEYLDELEKSRAPQDQGIPEYPAQEVTPQAPAFQFRTPQQMQVEEARQFVQTGIPELAQEVAPIGAAIASTGQALQIPELPQEQIAKLPPIVQPSAQMANLPAQFWNYAVSPGGLATAATFEVGGPLWRALLSAGFSTQAAQGAIESAMRGDWSKVPAEIATAVLTAAGARTEARAAYPLQRPEPQIIPGAPEAAATAPPVAPGPPPPAPVEVPPALAAAPAAQPRIGLADIGIPPAPNEPGGAWTAVPHETAEAAKGELGSRGFTEEQVNGMTEDQLVAATEAPYLPGMEPTSATMKSPEPEEPMPRPIEAAIPGAAVVPPFTPETIKNIESYLDEAIERRDSAKTEADKVWADQDVKRLTLELQKQRAFLAGMEATSATMKSPEPEAPMPRPIEAAIPGARVEEPIPMAREEQAAQPLAPLAEKLRARGEAEGGFAANVWPDLIDFGQRVYQRGMDFAQWSVEMIRHLGERIREHLTNLWTDMNRLYAVAPGARRFIRMGVPEDWAKETSARAIAEHQDIAKQSIDRVLSHDVSRETQADLLRNTLPRELRSKDDVIQINNGIGFLRRSLVRAGQAALKEPWARPASEQYRGYNTYSHRLGDEFDHPPERVMRVESALSPNTSPEQSFEAARRLMKMVRDNSEHPFDERMADWARKAMTTNEKGETARLYSPANVRYLRGKKFSELPENNIYQAKWMRAFDEVYHPDRSVRTIRPNGTLGDLDRTSTGKPNSFAWTTFNHMQNGIDALAGSRPLHEILSTPKVANYYMSKLLAFERSNHVVVDTHHTSAGFGNSLPASNNLIRKAFAAGRGGPNREFGGLYSIIHEATVQAARELGMDPKAFQALVWAYQRGYRSPTAFGRTTAGKAAMQAIQNLWTDAARGRLTEEQAHEATEKIASDFHRGTVPAPAYFGERPGGEGVTAAGDSGYPAELPQRGRLPAGRPGSGVRGDVAARAAEAKLAPLAEKLRARADSQGGFINPEIFRDAVDFGRRVYQRGMDFARWSAEMVRHLGEGIREHLGNIWRSVTGAEFLPHARERGGIPIGKFAGGPEPPGPGEIARDINDPEKMRGHIATVQRMSEVSPDVKEIVESWYTPTSLPAVHAKANATIDKVGLDKAKDNFQAGKRVDADLMALGHNVAVRLDQLGRYDEAAEVRESMAEKLTNPAQAMWFISTIAKTSPEGLIRTAQRIVAEQVAADPAKQDLLAQIQRLQAQIQAQPSKAQAAATSIMLKQLAKVNIPGQRLTPSQLENLLTKHAAGELTPEELSRTLSKYYKIPTLTPENIATIKRAQKAWADVPDSNPLLKLHRGMQMMDSVYGLIPHPFWDKVRSVAVIDAILHGRMPIRIGVSNVMQMAGKMVADAVSAVTLDPLISFVTGKRTITGPELKARLSGITFPAQAFRAGYQDAMARQLRTWPAFKEGFQTMVDLAAMTTRGMFDLDNWKARSSHVFSSRFGRLSEDAVTTFHNVIPSAFFNAEYQASLARQMRIAGVKVPTTEMVDIARLDGNEAIFQNVTAVNTMLNKIRETLDIPTRKLTGMRYGLGTATLLFTKIPAAILTKGMEWSPLGFIRATWELPGLRSSLTKEPFRQRQFVDAFTKAALGTGGLVMTGYWLRHLGVITGGKEENRDLEAMRAASGSGKFRINLSELKRRALSGNWWTPMEHEWGDNGDVVASYNWVEPYAFGIAMGAGIYDAMKQRELQQKKGKITPTVVMVGAAAGAQTILEHPMLQNLNRLIEVTGQQGPISAVTEALMNVPGNFIPSVARQTSQLIDNTVRETSGTGLVGSNVSAGLEVDRMVNRLAVNIPWISERFPPKYDVLGRAVERYNYGKNSVINIFFDPAFPQLLKKDPSTNELMNIWKQTGESGVVPGRVPVKITINKQQVQLTNEQVATYQRYVGQLSSAGIMQLLASPNFAALPLAYKQSYIAQVISAANQAAKVDLFGDAPAKISPKGAVRTMTPQAMMQMMYGRQMGLNVPVPTGPMPPAPLPPELLQAP
jgi:tail lysozyme